MCIKEGVFFPLGQLSSMSFLRGGSSIRLFSPSVYNFLCGMNPCDIIVSKEQVPNKPIIDVLEKVLDV